MQSLEDAATRLLQNIEDWPVEYLLGSAEELKRIRAQAPMEPFAAQTIEFLGEVSAQIRQAGRRDLQDAATFAFWCRPAHLNLLKKQYVRDGGLWLGRGVSLHFAPGNIPTQFAYTAAAGLLAGNCAVVRLSRTKTPQEDLLAEAFRKAMENGFEDFRGRVILIRYPHDESITAALSACCDVRVMWGSNESVQAIRRTALMPGAVEIPFAARDSAAVFDAQAVLETEDLTALCRDFYNDTYLNDQNACSAPHVVFWLGGRERAAQAQEKFWNAFEKILDEKGWKVQAETAVQKLTAAYAAAAGQEGLRICRKDNRIVRIQAETAVPELWTYARAGGFFIELSGETPDPLLPLLDRTCQTVSTFGVDPAFLAEFSAAHRVRGVDRVVPVGHTLDFELTWDGFNLIEQMSRRIMV